MASNTSALCYKYQLVSEPDDALKCLICLDVAEEPWQHVECGKLFCKKCLDDYGLDKSCPHCRDKQAQYFKDTKSKANNTCNIIATNSHTTSVTHILLTHTV